MEVLIIGCGYVGVALGEKLAKEGHTVTGIRRSADAEKELREAGIRPLMLDIRPENAFEHLPVAYDWVVNCISSSKGTEDDYRGIL